MCVVEAILRQGDNNDVFQRVASMFEEDCGSIVENAQSPQASLKEKSKKVCYTSALMIFSGLRNIHLCNICFLTAVRIYRSFGVL